MSRQLHSHFNSLFVCVRVCVSVRVCVLSDCVVEQDVFYRAVVVLQQCARPSRSAVDVEACSMFSAQNVNATCVLLAAFGINAACNTTVAQVTTPCCCSILQLSVFRSL
jgi:hypothetical protein